MARLLETDSLNNQNFSTAVSIASYTCATLPRLVYVRVLLKDMAGNGDYICYATLTKAGTEYRVIPITTATAAAALTSLAFVSVPIPMDVGDILQAYLDGLAGDNAACDSRVDFYEMDHVRVTTPDLTLDVSTTGEVGLDFDNIKQATNPTTLTNITVPVVTAITNGVTLADDAISAGKFDESSAFPLGAAYTSLATAATQTTILARLGAWTGTTTNTILGALRSLMNKAIVAPTDITSGGTFDASTDSLEAIRDTAPLGTAMRGTDGAELTGAAAAALAAYDPPTNAELTSGLAAIPAAVWGYATRTLTSLSALVASIAMAVWANATRTLTQSAAAVTAAVSGSELTVTQAATFDATLSGLTINAAWTSVKLTVKRGTDEADHDALLQLVVSNPPAAATDGALYVERAAATAAQRTQASLTVNQAAGTVAIHLQDDLTAVLAAVSGARYDVKQFYLDGTETKSDIIAASAAWNVQLTETQAIA